MANLPGNGRLRFEAALAMNLALLLEADRRIDLARDRIHMQNERITQMELGGREATSARRSARLNCRCAK